MKTESLFIAIFTLLCFAASGQVYIYDQQSVTSDSEFGASSYSIQSDEPMGQSFIPVLSSVGFVRLYIVNGGENPTPATVYVNLLEDSITGPVLGQTESVSLPGGYISGSPINFFFTDPLTVTPGVTYYLQPVAMGNPDAGVIASGYIYSDGSLFLNGSAYSPEDLWFREGIVVPEPSPLWLLWLGGGISLYVRHVYRNSRLI